MIPATIPISLAMHFTTRQSGLNLNSVEVVVFTWISVQGHVIATF